MLRFHVQRVPGWSATIDGHPLALHPYSVAMLQADVPAGHHVVRLRYQPEAFLVGLGVFALTVLALVTTVLVGVRRRSAARRERAQD